MKSKKTSENDILRKFGRHLEAQIKKQGYASVYDFWVQQAGDDFSRSGLNYIVSGKREPKLLTLLQLADLLDISPAELMDF